MYRRTALRRLGGDSHAGQLKALLEQIAELDPGADLSTDLTLTAFEHPRPQQSGMRGTQDRARYFIGASLMLIAVTVFIGLITIKLTADGFGNAHTAQRRTKFTPRRTWHSRALPRIVPRHGLLTTENASAGVRLLSGLCRVAVQRFLMATSECADRVSVNTHPKHRSFCPALFPRP